MKTYNENEIKEALRKQLGELRGEEWFEHIFKSFLDKLEKGRS